MSTSKNRSLIFIIAVLLLTNIAVLAYFLWYKKPTRPPEGGHDRGRGIEVPLQKEVGFNEEQMSQYKQMRDQQMKAIKPMFDDMRKAKDSLFRMISNDNANDSSVNAVGDAIAQKQKEMDLRMYNHFKRIRSLCTPAQLPKYDSVIQRMMRKMGKPRRDPDRKDGK
ncbi:MAG: periplasmic heavy metal sensor [Bacteroidetes bacterium]|jgi:protein CpxP|nr:MAG: periplasmic heavy metal sensor [Bacteroidota bacterium]